jgi:hypothetical protein
MKQRTYYTCIALLWGLAAQAQEQFSSIAISRRGGLLNADINPAELANFRKSCEINILSVGGNFYNNKLSLRDLDSDEKLYNNSKELNGRLSGVWYGPGVGIKLEKWAFAVSTKASTDFSFKNLDPTLLGLTAGYLDTSFSNVRYVQSNKNQRASASSWGEVVIGAAHNLHLSEKHKINVGVNVRLLFPTHFSNVAFQQVSGTAYKYQDSTYFSGGSANLNIGYSEPNKMKLGGYAIDLGANYQWKDEEEDYKLNAGIALRNLGQMTYNFDSTYTTNYQLNVPSDASLTFEEGRYDLTDAKEVERALQESGYLTTVSSSEAIKVRMPAMLVLYADMRWYKNVYTSLCFQRKLFKDDNNRQITSQNLLTLAPKFSTRNFEASLPLTIAEHSGFNSGLCLRAGFFFIGSSSVFTALLNGKQADVFLGFRFGVHDLH